MNIKIKIDVKKVQRYIEGVAKQIPYASSVALNNLAFGVKDEEVKALDQHLDRPTPFTKRAYEVKKASKARLVAVVQARAIQGEYLKYQVEGGSRPPKGTANVVPVNQRLNQYGNMPKGAVKRLLASGKAFSGRPAGGGAAGIYQRMGGKKAPKLRLMVAYEKAVQYRKRLPFEEIARDYINANADREMNKAMAHALKTAR